jgi:glutathione S-transferase
MSTAAITRVRKLYDLAAADPNLRFSPYCWRTKLALAHKGLPVETIPWRFTEKEEIAFSGQQQVPVLVDGKTVVYDSQSIAEYLETTYPEAPSLFGDAASRALTLFIKNWVEVTLHPAIVKIVMPDIFKIIHPKDQPYFRQSREARIGITIEALGAQRAEHLPALNALLAPLRQTLRAQKFLTGDTPLYADHIVFGALQWARKTSSTPLLEADGPISRWMAAILAHYANAIADT